MPAGKIYFRQLAEIILPAGKTHFAGWQNSICQLAISFCQLTKLILPAVKLIFYEFCQLAKRVLTAGKVRLASWQSKQFAWQTSLRRLAIITWLQLARLTLQGEARQKTNNSSHTKFAEGRGGPVVIGARRRVQRRLLGVVKRIALCSFFSCRPDIWTHVLERPNIIGGGKAPQRKRKNSRGQCLPWATSTQRSADR